MNRTLVNRFGISMALVVLIVIGISGCLDSTEPEQALRIGLIPTEDQIEMLKKFGPV